MKRSLFAIAAFVALAGCGNSSTPASTTENTDLDSRSLLPSTSPTASATDVASTPGSRSTTPPVVTARATPSTRAAPSAQHSPRVGEPGITGQVVAGPSCPVERPDEPCPDRPVANAQVVIKGQGVHKNTTTNAQGRFHADTPPGRYSVTATSSSVFGCAEQTVTVEKDRVSHVTITCDTGIR